MTDLTFIDELIVDNPIEFKLIKESRKEIKEVWKDKRVSEQEGEGALNRILTGLENFKKRCQQ